MTKTPPKTNTIAAPFPGNLLVIAASALLLVLGLLIALHGSGESQNFPAMDGINVLLQLLRICIESAMVLLPWWIAAAGFGSLLHHAFFPKEKQATPPQADASSQQIYFDFMLKLALGAVAMLLGAWLLAWAGALNQITSWLLCLAGMVAAFWRLILLHRQLPGGAMVLPKIPWALALALPGVALLIAAACCPPGLLWSVEAFGYDVMSYHLQLPREWMELGRMRPLEHNVYSYLPSLVEVGYLHISWLRGSVYSAIFTCQLFHASMAIMTAAMVAAMLAKLVRVTIAILIGVMLLCVPWVTITGSCAYDEMFAAFFGAAALALVCDEKRSGWRLGSAVGFLLAGATLSKITSGAMLAVPMGIMLIFRPIWLCGETSQNAKWKNAITAALFAGLVGTLFLTPYFARNAIASGNPVFPFLAKQLGHGHWDEQLVERWNKGHMGEGSLRERLVELKKQGWSNTGYGAIGGAQRVRGEARFESRNVARFDQEQGFSPLWLAMALATIVAIFSKKTHRFSLALLGLLIFEIFVWIFVTHLQSRFLLPVMLPGLVLLALGLDNLANQKFIGGKPVIALCLVLVLILYFVDLATFWHQTIRISNEKTQAMESVPPWLLVDTLPPESRLDLLQLGDVMAGDHILNHLVKPSGKVLLIADVSRLLYIRRPMIYNSAFDPDLLGKIYRENKDDLASLTRALHERGITHVWVHWSELERLSGTYGFDHDITAARIEMFAKQGNWKDVFVMQGVTTCYELP